MKDPRIEASRRSAQGSARPDDIGQARQLARNASLAAPGVASLEQAWKQLNHTSAARWAAFSEEFAAATTESPERRRAWTQALLDEVITDAVHPQRLLLSHDSDDSGLSAAVEAWREESNPLSVWGRRHEARQLFRGEIFFFQLSLLLLIDPLVWCHAIDRLPFPGLMTFAFSFYAHVAEDRELIVKLLKVAPPVFDLDGRWVQSRSVSALLVTEQILAHARLLHDAVYSQTRGALSESENIEDRRNGDRERLRSLEEEELPRWMREAFTVLVDRPDREHLATALLGELARKVLLGRNHAIAGSFWAEAQALRVLGEVLGGAGVCVRHVRDRWLAERARIESEHALREPNKIVRAVSKEKLRETDGEGARTLQGDGFPLLFGAATMLGNDPQSLDELEALWRWFEELLLGRDPGLAFVRYGTGIADIPQRLGFLLSRTPDSGKLFRTTYTALEPQRRRSAFAYRYEDFDHDLGSILLARIGLYTSGNCAARDMVKGSKDARALFWWVYDAALRLWLTSANDFEHQRPDLVTTAYAFMPLVFGDDLPSALRRALPPLANHARMVADAGWSLWRNGVAAEQLIALFRCAGAELETSLRNAHQWASLVRDQSQPGPEHEEEREFPTELRELAAALGITLDEDVGAPPQSERARRREDLARSIPWGKKLLDRLEQDGCPLSRIEPLDANGTSWLLQVSVSEAVRARFGLSPDLRVLAVHGDVRGRALREALQDPRAAALCDPDLIVVACDQPDLANRLPRLAGPWGQRIPWPPGADGFSNLADTLREHVPSFDLFDYRDPVRGTALVGRRAEIDDLTARLLRGEAVALIGLRKVGKSSLLRAVAESLDPIGARRGMFESLSVPLPDADPEALVVSLDIQGVAGRGLAVLLDRLNSVLEDRLSRAKLAADPQPLARPDNTLTPGHAHVVELSARDPLRSLPPPTDPMEQFRALLKLALDRYGLPVCFMLDEYDLLFEGYGGEPGVAGIEQLFALLRTEAQTTRRVSLAMIGRDPSFLDEPLLGGFTNPLAGWAKHVYLGSLRQDEMGDLLTRLGKRVGLDIGPATLADAWRWTGGHPLLARQYGAALFDLAHAPPSRPRPVPTDPIAAEAGEAFMNRAAVQTICTEVHALLEARFPEALALIQDIAQAPAEEARTAVLRHGGPRAKAAQVLERFGLLGQDAGGPWIPLLFREVFSGFENETPSMNKRVFG